MLITTLTKTPYGRHTGTRIEEGGGVGEWGREKEGEIYFNLGELLSLFLLPFNEWC